MSSINFYLDREDSNGLCPIFLVYQTKGKKFKHFTKEKVSAKYWDKKKQRAKHMSAAPEINDLLDFLAAKLQKIERQLRMEGGKASLENVKNKFLENKEDELGFYEFLEKTIKLMPNTLQRRTVMKYRTAINDLREFEKTYNYPLSFDKIDFQFQNLFLKFLSDVKLNTQNTVAKKMTVLKTLLNKATKSNVNKRLDYQDFKVKTVDSNKAFLDSKEFFRLLEMDLPSNSKLEKVRDIFCFGCLTGLRFSDIDSLKFEDIMSKTTLDKDVKYSIKIYVHKTKQPLIVPLNSYALTILRKYETVFEKSLSAINADPKFHKTGQKIFPSISLQKMNDYIKELGELADINTPINVTKYIGARRIDEVLPKYKLLATHAARRTFAILSLERGMRIEVLQKILGHKSIRTTMKYVFIQEDVKENEMLKAWG